MLVVIREVFAALFWIDDLVANGAYGKRIAAVLNVLMGPVADVLFAVGCGAFRIRHACGGAKKQGGERAD